MFRRCAAAAFAALLLVGISCVSAGAHPGSSPRIANLATGADDYLDGVSCATATYCIAVGIHVNASGNDYQSISELWNGTRWVTKPTVHPSPTDTSLFAVSCPAVDACYAVGTYDTDTDGHTASLVEFWNGVAWQLQASPNPAGGNPYTSLTAVSCPSAVVCVATGAHSINVGKAFLDHAISERWNGKLWALHGVSHPARSFDGLYALSCPDQADCQAVGTTQPLPYSVPNSPFAEGMSTASWSIEPVPSPVGEQGTQGAALNSVSCAAAGACEAVGDSYIDGIGTSETSWATQWNGTAWSAQPVEQSPAGEDSLAAVSCPPTQLLTDCEAVGKSATGAVAELWNGHTWTSQPFPSPAGATSDAAAVSCLIATDCEAVGATGNGTLAERWNGSAWAVQTTTNPGG